MLKNIQSFSQDNIDMSRYCAAVLLFLIQLGDCCPELCQCFTAAKVICSDDTMRVLPVNISAQVKELIVVASGLTYMDRSSFREDLRLTKLVILNNLLKTISYNTFENLVELQELEISGNSHLLTFKMQTFNKLTNLSRLSLNNNKISLDNDIFDPLQKLETLQLRGNNLSSLPNLLFHNLHNLLELDLSLNHVSSLSADIFQNNSRLRVLSLQGNMISQLPEGIFSHLDALEDLNLRNNHIINLNPGVFPSNLQKLILKNNMLVQLSPMIFDKLQQLTYLDLSQNQLSELPSDLFQNLSSLKNLDLSENQITALPGTVFKGLVKIKAIHLQKNNLSSLKVNLFMDQQDMDQLYLSKNSLQNIPNGFFDYLNFHCIVQLHGNPWRCDCEIQYLHHWLRYNHENVEDLSRVYCKAPEFIRGQNLLSIDQEQLVCVKNSSSITPGVTKILPNSNNDSTIQCSLQELKGAISIQCKVTKCTSVKFQALFEHSDGNYSKYIESIVWSAPLGCFNGTA
ncbi:carboxypeptidase N subunit 2 isoform X2 [Myxocyprinus asiaticus]|uniref:carboxypeptidase N subunit 2 isoform X2 n=1 Tax=Myxocyprinus asiaticus TaxID=70543 RepID=UPI002223C13E|nr:carboxypeptidase N subunit 2 isoform X2 [Myxocyprinus asiaticus]